jgi:hypothetical protein
VHRLAQNNEPREKEMLGPPNFSSACYCLLFPSGATEVCCSLTTRFVDLALEHHLVEERSFATFQNG